MRAAGRRVDHLLAVAMIRSDQCDAARLAYALRDPTEAVIDVLAGFDRLVEFAGVAHHVGVRKIDDENVRVALINAAQHFVRHFESRHLWLQIVSRDLW